MKSSGRNVTGRRAKCNEAAPWRTVMVVLLVALAALVMPATAASTAAEFTSYPNRPIRIVLAFSGGAGESLIRIVGDRLERELGQAVVIEAHPGAAGNIASDLVARAPPDGYT